jgi:glycosyltransferase involved in cell wall biosynthesis
MRVLHIHSGNLYGGVETLLVTLARHRDLCPNLEPHFALCFEGRLSEELAAAETPVYLLGNVRVSRPVSLWRSRRILGDLLRQKRFDVVVCHSAWSQAIFGPVVRSARLPLVFWLHDAAGGGHWLERWASTSQPDLVVANSRFTASTLTKIYPAVRAEVVYCPVESPNGRSTWVDRAQVRAELNASQDAAVIIQASRMEVWKGHALHLEALGMLRDLPGWVCWQVGGAQRPHESEYVEKLKSAAARLGIADRISFLGERWDVPRLLAAADVYCQPNTGPEPFGIAFLEALYAGLPVVTTAIGGAMEIVDDSCGILAPRDDAKALAGCLRKLIQDSNLREQLGATGPARARELCDPAIQMARVNELLTCTVRQETVNDCLQLHHPA